ncbi:MAG: DUF1080 domain-containing protein [Planctomycetes bacterium]|nr:DUF1080 domain-containing protein [Planctomycetota bacterium]
MMKYLLLGLVLLAGSVGLYPDEDTASIYLKKAQELARKKAYKEALDNFNKAINEAPEQVDAYLALGELYRDINESDEAVANFRKALALIEQKGSPDKFKSVQNKINSYLAEYDKNRQELVKFRDQFLQSLWSLVVKYEKDDLQFALLVTERALKIDATNALFINKRLELSKAIGELGKEQMASLFNGTDLDGWKGASEDWQVENEAIRFECDKPEILSGLSYKIKLESDYVFTSKFKMEKVYGSQNFLMLAFGYQSLSNNYAFGIFDQKLALVRHEGDKPYRKIKEKELPPGIDLVGWNELTVEVYGDAVRCYLNGDLCLEMEESDKTNLRGLVALVGNNCSGYFKDIMYSSEE